jgi:LPXTG-motif cell wall-anchored protein
VLAATALVALSSGVAYAGDREAPVKDVVGDVEKEFEGGQQAPQEPAPAPDPGTGSSEPETPVATDQAAAESTDQSTGESAGTTAAAGDETREQRDRVHAQMAKVAVGEQPVVDVGRSEASMQDNGRSHAHATALALFGQEIVGTRADSHGEQESHAGDPLAPLCEGSEGALCLRVLYADAAADERGRSSSARSQSGVANACLGGSNTDVWSECDGQISAEVATSEAQMRRTDGRTHGSSESQVADVCIGRDGETCAAGLTLLQAASKAFWDGRTEGSSTTGRLVLGGEEVGAYEDRTDVSVQPDCTAPSLVCVLLNQGGSSIENGHVEQAQHALDIGVLPDTVGVAVGVSSTGASVTHGAVLGVHGSRGDGDVVAGVSGSGGPGAPGTVAGVGSVLPNTGGVWSGLVALALAALGAGSLLVARNRRRVGTSG